MSEPAFAADSGAIAVPGPAPFKAFDPPSAAPSPARELQQRLAERIERADAADTQRRWSPRSTILFAGGASVLLWGAIIVAVHALL